MPERSALLLGTPRSGIRARPQRGGRDTIRGPSRQRQVERLGPQFERVTRALDAQRLAITGTPAALEPKTILVLEIAGEVTQFARAMQQVPGLEFLGEQALAELEPDEDFTALDQRGRERGYRRQLFLLASDARAWREILSLWDRWQAGESPARGLTPFRDLFAQLRELREWDDRDRLNKGGAGDAWRRDLLGLGAQLVPFEAELWFRSDPRRRWAAVDAVRVGVTELGGRIADELVLEDADYHGVLGYAPAQALFAAAQQGAMAWMSTEGVRLFHATGQMVARVEDEDHDSGAPAIDQAPPAGVPRIALLDGLPVAAHHAIAGRLRIDDPDDWAAAVPASQRRHGTLMASAVTHGDLDKPSSLTEPVYVRPILRPDPAAWFPDPPERLPPDRLPVDVVHQAVARLFEGDNPAAETTRVIVLAIGDASQQFDRFVSPLARLLDWLAWRYDVLFLISAGNHTADLEIDADADLADPAELEREVLDAMRRDALSRRLLAPGESLNAITVGAAHDDASAAPAPDDLLDPLLDSGLASVISPTASGINRAIKPDVLLPGGRQLLRAEPLDDRGGARRLSVVPSLRPPGVRVAAPGRPGELDRSVHVTGTSVATGIAGNAAGVILQRLDALASLYGDAFPPADFWSVLTKAALAHTARWGSAGSLVRDVLQDAGERGTRAQVGRFLGHGRALPAGALVGDDHRAVLLQAGRLSVDESHRYELPVPPSLRSVAVERRLIVTLAWFSPIRPRNRAYRAAALTLSYQSGRDTAFGDREESDHNAAGRGTLQHEVLYSRRAVPFADNARIPLEVSCRATAGPVDVSIPYGLVVTVDTPIELALPIYDEIRAAVPVAVPVGVRAR